MFDSENETTSASVERLEGRSLLEGNSRRDCAEISKKWGEQKSAFIVVTEKKRSVCAIVKKKRRLRGIDDRTESGIISIISFSLFFTTAFPDGFLLHSLAREGD